MIIGLHRCITTAAHSSTVAMEGREMVSLRKYMIRIISISVLHLISEWTGFCYLPYFVSILTRFIFFSPSWIRDVSRFFTLFILYCLEKVYLVQKIFVLKHCSGPPGNIILLNIMAWKGVMNLILNRYLQVRCWLNLNKNCRKKSMITKIVPLLLC